MPRIALRTSRWRQLLPAKGKSRKDCPQLPRFFFSRTLRLFLFRLCRILGSYLYELGASFIRFAVVTRALQEWWILLVRSQSSNERTSAINQTKYDLRVLECSEKQPVMRTRCVWKHRGALPVTLSSNPKDFRKFVLLKDRRRQQKCRR